MNQALEQENLWGYAKRLSFVQEVIVELFPGQEPESLSVLDVGCGNGSYLAIPLARKGFNVTGTDLHEPSISQGLSFAKGLANLKLICTQLEDLPRTEFDVVILSEVLEHVLDPEALLRVSTSYLKGDGVMIVTVPNGYGEFEIDSWIFRLLGFEHVLRSLTEGSLKRVGRALRRKDSGIGATDNCESGHVQFFTQRRLREMFSRCQLRIYREGSSTFLSGPFVSYTLGRSRRFIEWNARIANRLPMRLVSGWYFALRPQT